MCFPAAINAADVLHARSKGYSTSVLRRRRVCCAHDDVMRVLEEEVMREAPPDRRGVWDTRVRDLCLQVLSVVERQILVRKWKGQLGGPRMDADFDSWHRVMRNKWTKMKELRSQTRGGERQGQSSRRFCSKNWLRTPPEIRKALCPIGVK